MYHLHETFGLKGKFSGVCLCPEIVFIYIKKNHLRTKVIITSRFIVENLKNYTVTKFIMVFVGRLKLFCEIYLI